MKKYIATSWLMCEDNVIRRQINKEVCKSKEEFLGLVTEDMMLLHSPLKGWHVSIGPITVKEINNG